MERGVKHDSVLSHNLFLIVMEFLLKQLKEGSHGLSVSEIYSGAAIHADDRRTTAASMDSTSNRYMLDDIISSLIFTSLAIVDVFSIYRYCSSKLWDVALGCGVQGTCGLQHSSVVERTRTFDVIPVVTR